MGIVDFLLRDTISKRVSQELAVSQSNALANAMQSINIGINQALPSINPDAGDYYQQFKTIGAVYEVVDLITKKFLNCPPVYYKIKDARKLQLSKTLLKTDPIQSYILKQQAVQEIELPDLTKLLTNGMANPYQTGTQLMYTTASSFLLHGNTYLNTLTGGGKAKELYCYPNMIIWADPEDLMNPVRGYRMMSASTIVKDYLPEDIQHIKTGTPAPVDRRMEYLYGVAPLRAYLESLRAIREGKTQASKQAKNGGVFGFISPKNKEDQFEKDQKDDLKERLLAARRSNDELSRLFPSSIGLDFTQVGLPIAELQLLELVEASEEDVYRAYHVPLSYHNQKASTDNNVGTEVKKLVYDAIAPVCDTMGEAFTIMLGKGYGFDVMEFDYTQLPEMAINMGEVASYLKSLPFGVLSPNEQREALKYGSIDDPAMNARYILNTMTTMQRVFDGTNQPPAQGASAPQTE